MDNRETIPFVVHYRNNTKVLKSTTSGIVENVKEKFESCPGFLSNLDCSLNIKIAISLLIWVNQ